MSVCLVTSSLFRYKLYYLARRADICDAAVSRPVVIRQRAPVACFPWLGLPFVSVLRHLLIIGNHVDAHEFCVPSPFFPILFLPPPLLRFSCATSGFSYGFAIQPMALLSLQ